MNVMWKNEKITTKKILSYLKYLNDVIKENNLFQDLDTINIKNNKLLGTNLKFSEIKKVLTLIEVITEVQKPTKIEAPKYQINKYNFILVFSICYAIENLTENDKRKKSSTPVQIDIWVLYKNIKNLISGERIDYNDCDNTFKKILFLSLTLLLEIYNYTIKLLINKRVVANKYKGNLHNINKYIKKYIISVSKYDVYFNNYYCSYKYRIKTVAPLIYQGLLTDDISYNKINNVDEELINLFQEKCDLSTYKDIWISNDIRRKYGDKTIKKAYISFVAYNSPLIKEIINTTNYINGFKKIKISSKINVQITNLKGTGGLLKLSLRQNNKLCNVDKETRTQENKTLGYDLSYDMHSAIYSVVNYFNTNIFDSDWDIKNEIIKYGFSDINNNKLRRKDIKKIILIIFFTSNLECAFKTYFYYAYEQTNAGESLPLLSKDTFIKLYKTVNSLVPNTNKYKRSIFLYESLIELYTIKECLNREYDIRNVYDGFYFKSSQTSEDEIKIILENSFIKVKKFTEPANILKYN